MSTATQITNGVNVDQLIGTINLIKENPSDPRNRRISIILLYPDKKKAIAVLGPQDLGQQKAGEPAKPQ